ncbi:hypothetical protein DDQ68_21910 [Hymenobacter nivis]|uniref:Integrase catalytic domain-containing protein n=1 Tax=Hymenobacter nivis TaxID=1850093 RepID=A0A2Z3GU41_9BACT|nr:hypothetical protein DDQ68_21910 [Hymenobacter nivis]
MADALRVAPAPHIFHSDQGSQFMSLAYEQALLAAGCRISRDGRGRATDNAFIDRLWRTVKWEHSTSTRPMMATTCTSNYTRVPTTIIADPTKACAARHPPRSSLKPTHSSINILLNVPR